MMKHLIDTQFDLAILLALDEIGEPTSIERIVFKTKKFWLRWKKQSKKQEVTRIRGRLSKLTNRGIVIVKKNHAKASYSLNPEYEPSAIIGEYLDELFKDVPITIWGNEVLFDYEEVNEDSLIFTLPEIRESIFKYGFSEYV